MLITSLTNPTVKHLVRMRDNRARRKAGRVLVDGWRETKRALEAGLRPLGVYATQFERADWATELASDALCRVSDDVLQKIAYGQSDRGVVAEFERPAWNLQELQVPCSGLILVMDRIEKPGNAGAVFRCADACGADAVLLTPESSDPFNPNLIRSSLGAVFTVPSASVSEQDARQWLAQRDYRVCAARVESSRPLWESDLTGPLAIVIGNEADGLGANWQSDDKLSIDGVRIPMLGQVDSLNASVAAAVILYESQRQRSNLNPNP